MAGSFKVSFKEKGDVVVIRITGRMWGHPQYREVLYDPVNEYLDNGVRKFIIDMSGVRLIASIGVGFVNMVYASVKNEGGELALCGMNDRVLNVFHVMELTKIYRTFDSCDEAIETLQG